MKKYEITSNTKEFAGRKLFQIRALKDFDDVKAGDLGGYIEKEENLSHDGNAWVSGNAQIYGNAQVCGNVRVCDNIWISDDAWVCGNTWVCGIAYICGNAWVCSNSDYICFKGFGSENRNTTMFKTKNGDICVCCGCFEGSLKEFEEKVKDTHGNTKYAKEYLACIEVAKIHFGTDE